MLPQEQTSAESEDVLCVCVMFYAWDECIEIKVVVASKRRWSRWCGSYGEGKDVL